MADTDQATTMAWPSIPKKTLSVIMEDSTSHQCHEVSSSTLETQDSDVSYRKTNKPTTRSTTRRMRSNKKGGLDGSEHSGRSSNSRSRSVDSRRSTGSTSTSGSRRSRKFYTKPPKKNATMESIWASHVNEPLSPSATKPSRCSSRQASKRKVLPFLFKSKSNPAAA